jgi:OPA family glycerol-3-phosphate transporter-like MFS transporter
VFLGAATCGAAMVVFWSKTGRDVPPSPPKNREGSKAATRALFTPVMLCIMVVIAFHGMLRDSVMTWMPSYVAETYQLDNSAAILSGVILPVFSLVCFRITERLHRKVFPNLLVCASVLFGASILASGVLYLFPGSGAAIAVFMLAVIKGCMSGVNFLLISILPRRFRKHGNISTVSGVLNSATYVGSAVSTYGIAVISETFGWSASTLTWLILSIACAAICLVNIPVWKKTYPES